MYSLAMSLPHFSSLISLTLFLEFVRVLYITNRISGEQLQFLSSYLSILHRLTKLSIYIRFGAIEFLIFPAGTQRPWVIMEQKRLLARCKSWVACSYYQYLLSTMLDLTLEGKTLLIQLMLYSDLLNSSLYWKSSRCLSSISMDIYYSF